MVRGSGKFKTKRGGGRNFSKNMVLDENGTAVSTDRRWTRRDKGANDDDDEENGDVDEEEEGEEGENDDDEDDEDEDDTTADGASKSTEPELSRTERRELKKKQAAQKQAGEEDEDPYLINPNHVEKKLNISDLGSPRELTRREREQKDKADAKERYWKLHVQGKTQEAKADLSRLAKIRADREAAQAKRKAEAEAKAAEIEVKRKAQQGGKKI